MMKETPATELCIRLRDPGMTPILRAGLGGLAASLNAIPKDKLAKYGLWEIEPHALILRWHQPGHASEFLKNLFAECFRIDEAGLIDLPATYTGTQDLAVRACLQKALRQTILQHGWFAKKNGKPRPLTIEIDGTHTIGIQPYKWFKHQDAHVNIAKELDRPAGNQSALHLASWANPGAVERHSGLSGTEIEYAVPEALCAIFALIGTISLHVPHGGALLICEPDNLIHFAKIRPRLTPRSLPDCHVSGGGDAVLSIEVALRAARMQDESGAVSSITAWIFNQTAWSSPQKNRAQILPPIHHPEASLSAFQELASMLPARIVPCAAKEKNGLGEFFSPPNVLRRFVTENLDQGHAWHRGFSTCFHSHKKMEIFHFFANQKGLRAMIERLAPPESILIRSIHTALRQRFGAIGDETRSSPADFKKRCSSERERWRLAFAGAKTLDQVRFALVNLWSRAGTVKELQSSWQDVIPFLQEDRWLEARDLALIALASYEGRGAIAQEPTPGSATDD